MINRQRCLGTSPSRPDGLAKAVGSAVFTDDIVLDGMLHGATVRCPHPHARILRIDASAALEVSGVTVVTASDLPGPNALQLIEDDWPILGSDVVHHAEEAVALVAAPTREQARKAAALVEVEYEELPVIVDPHKSMDADAPIIREDIAGQDEVGHAAVRDYAERAERAGADPAMVAAVRDHANDMEAWPKKKVPDV